MYDGHDLTDEPIRRYAQPDGLRTLRNLMLLILHNAAQDAAGRLNNGKHGTERAASKQDARDARLWLLSDDEHEPAVIWSSKQHIVRDEQGRWLIRERIIQGASCRWILRELGADPDVVQEQIRRLGWDELCNRLTNVTRSIRRNPESAPRKRPLDARTGPQGDDREAGDTYLAELGENGATPI